MYPYDEYYDRSYNILMIISSYSPLQADMYSYGITLYELVTMGKHPFDDLGFRSELDDAVTKGRRLDPITTKGAAPWPDIEDLIDHCLEPVPEHRPTVGLPHSFS